MPDPQITIKSTATTENVAGGGMGGNLHFSFSPVVHALDAEGVDRVLTRHQRLFEAKVNKYLRKKGHIAK